LAEGLQPLTYQLHRLIEGHHRRTGGQGRFEVIDVLLLIAQGLPVDAPVAVPDGQVAAEGVQDVVVYLHGDKVGAQGCL